MNVKRLLPLLSLLAFACDKPQVDLAREPVTVFATFFPLADVAREVGGDRVRVDWLVELGKPADGFMMTRRERDRMSSTDYTLCDGYRRSEFWAAPDLAQRQNTGRVIGCDTLPISTSEPPEGLLFLDPIVVRQLAPVIAAALSRSRPGAATVFANRADDFIKRVDALVAGYPNTTFGNGKVLVCSPTYAPLLARFGIDSVVADRDVYRLSDDDLGAMRRSAEQNDAASILVPYDLPPGAVTRIQAQTGLPVFQIDSSGFSEFKGHDSYLNVLRFNLEQLKLATVVKPK